MLTAPTHETRITAHAFRRVVIHAIAFTMVAAVTSARTQRDLTASTTPTRSTNALSAGWNTGSMSRAVGSPAWTSPQFTNRSSPSFKPTVTCPVLARPLRGALFVTSCAAIARTAIAYSCSIASQTPSSIQASLLTCDSHPTNIAVTTSGIHYAAFTMIIADRCAYQENLSFC